MAGKDGADNPGVVAPPPLIFGGALAAGLLANRLRPTPFLPRAVARSLGWLLLGGGLLLGDRGYGRCGTPAPTWIRTSPRPPS